MFAARILSVNTKKSAPALKWVTNLRAMSSSANNNFIIDSGLPDVEIPRISIPDLILSRFDKYDKLIASECAETGRKYTYAEIRQKARNLGKSLRKKLKFDDGDVVALLLPNIPEYPIAVLGALQVGIVVTTLNPIYTPEEISRQLADSSAKAVVTLNQFYDVARSSTKLLKKDLPIVTIKTEANESLPQGAISFNEFADNPVDFPDFHVENPEKIAFLPYSSGTTGMPKGVELVHRNIVANVVQNDAPGISMLESGTENFQEIVPSVLPMFHIYGLTLSTLFLLYKGSKSITLPKFTPDLYVDVLRKHKPTQLFTAPPLILFMTAHPEVKPEYFQEVRASVCGAAPLGALDEERFLEKVGKKIPILQGYGLTETSPVVTTTPVKLKEEKNVSGSIGKPIPNTLVKIIGIDDPTGTPLGPNKTGELLVKGPQVMRGYRNKPEETKNTFLDGWLRTGDMAYYNEDNVFFIADRLKELIKVKGFQVPPAELEEIIRDFPGVEEAAVIGIPHAKLGEVPRAYVMPKKNAEINSAELEKFVTSKVAEYKRLRGGIALVESIPKNASGKILRRTLKLQFEQEKQK